jgi:hypothetical protein
MSTSCMRAGFGAHDRLVRGFSDRQENRKRVFDGWSANLGYLVLMASRRGLWRLERQA